MPEIDTSPFDAADAAVIFHILMGIRCGRLWLAAPARRSITADAKILISLIGVSSALPLAFDTQGRWFVARTR